LRLHAAARHVRLLRRFHQHAQALQGLAEEARLTEHDLETVVRSRVVAAGDHHAAVGAEVVHREVQLRGGSDTHVDDVSAASHEALHQGCEDARAGKAAVARDGDARCARLGCRAQQLGEAAADAFDESVVEVAVRDGPDVVLTKDMRAHSKVVSLRILARDMGDGAE
jgi:hypothetical protein